MEFLKKHPAISFGIGFIALLIFLFWSSNYSKKVKVENVAEKTSREVALTCTTDMATQYHIHPLLTIKVDGNPVEIPNNIGIKPACMTSIHTHTEPGVVHVEAPIEKQFTLGDFFVVWGKDFSRNEILDKKTDGNSQIVVTVNGKAVDTYENTILSDKDQIVIEYKKK